MHRINTRLLLILAVVIIIISISHYVTRVGNNEGRAHSQSNVELQKQKLNQLMSSFDENTPPDMFRNIIRESYALAISLLRQGYVDSNVTDAVYKTIAFKIKSFHDVLSDVRESQEIFTRQDQEAKQFIKMLQDAGQSSS